MNYSRQVLMYLALTFCCALLLMGPTTQGRDAGTNTAASSGNEMPINIIISTDKLKYTIGDQVFVHIVLTNQSTASIKYLEEGDALDFDILLTDSRSNSVPMTEYGRDITESRATRMMLMLTIAPNGVRQYKYNISQLYNIVRPDLYSLIVKKMFQNLPPHTNWIDVASNTIKIQMEVKK